MHALKHRDTKGAAALNLKYLLRLRWGMLLGQLALVLLGHAFLQLGLPTSVLLSALGFGLVTNLGFHLWQRRGPAIAPAHIAGIMVLDAALLTFMLYLSGGPFNPFSTLYLVNVVLAAVLLPATYAWSVCLLSLGCFAALFPLQRATPAGLSLPGHVEMMALHLHGMWLAFALAAALLLSFVLRLKRALAGRERELAAAEDLAARRDKLSSLATLAGGAAHELATPLSTIAIILGDLHQALRPLPAPAEVTQDVRLAQEQVQRCRDILRQMSAEAGELSGEVPLRVAVKDCLALVESRLEREGPARLELRENGHGARLLEAPPQALAATLRGLIKNASQASEAQSPVRLDVTHPHPSRIAFEVVDSGKGMAPEVLARAGEPFFTTKAPGEGMGLGLFLARALAEQLGGTLSLDSKPGVGTRVRFELPLAVQDGGP